MVCDCGATRSRSLAIGPLEGPSACSRIDVLCTQRPRRHQMIPFRAMATSEPKLKRSGQAETAEPAWRNLRDAHCTSTPFRSDVRAACSHQLVPAVGVTLVRELVRDSCVEEAVCRPIFGQGLPARSRPGAKRVWIAPWRLCLSNARLGLGRTRRSAQFARQHWRCTTEVGS